MAKRRNPEQAKLIERFMQDPAAPELREVMPLIPRDKVARAIEAAYGLREGTLGLDKELSAEVPLQGLIGIAIACETLREAGISPDQYDYTTWLGTPQPGPLEGYSPKRYATFGEAQRIVDCATRTAERFKELVS